MKTATWLVPAAIAFASIPLSIASMAQQANTSTAQSVTAGSSIHEAGNANASAQAGRGNTGAAGSATASTAAAGTAGMRDARAAESGNAAARAEMRPVSGRLEGKLDSKTAHVGDRVVLKTTAKMKTADGTVIPKGTRLVGHVTDVQAHDRAHAESRMSFAFDHAELRNGESVAIHSAIQSVEPDSSVGANAASSDASLASEDSFLSPMGGGMAGGGARATGGGRLVGGGAPLGGAMREVGSPVSGQAAGHLTNTAMGTGAGLTSGANETVHSTGRIAGGAVGDASANLRGAAGAEGALAARATGMPGVMLRGSASGSSSGTLTAAKKNIHLDSSTQMDLGIVTEGKQ
jgi:hypothetical protein